MPQIVLAATQAAALAPAVAPAVLAPAAAGIGSAAAQTAALELAKQKAIETSMQQMAAQGAKQATAEAVKQQVGTEVAKQGLAQAGQQTGVEALKEGIFSANPAGMPPTAGAPVTPTGPAQPLPPAGGTPFTPPTTAAKPIDPYSQEYLRQTYPEQFAQHAGKTIEPGTAAQKLGEKAAETAYDPTKSPFSPFKSNSPALRENMLAYKEAVPAKTAELQAQISNLDGGLGSEFLKTVPVEQPSALKRGVMEGLEIVKKYPTETGLGLMAAGQYMNQPEEEDKDKYKNTTDMSKFQASVPTQRPFSRSYEYQSYAVGGPVEQMAAMNAVGTNTGYPQAGLQTPMYSNPAMQRPQATNVVAPSADAGVNTYTGEARFAEGGLSEAQRREYGLKTRSERAARNLTASYEEMEADRQKEAMKLFNESSLPTPRPIPRSRTQELSSPFSAAMAEHARLGKKAKVPVVPMPKTNLGDIDNYMDIPIEAAQGGIMHGLGGYSDGGRLLRGPGDGVSDSIPAVIGKRQPARLADGEFVIPARIVSELGNGSTEAGARKLYAMMERVQNSRKKSIGKKRVAVNSKADKHLPA